MKRADDKWDSRHIRSVIDAELEYFTLSHHAKERIIQKVRDQNPSVIGRLRAWLNYEIVLSIPQVSAAVMVACVVLGLFWYQGTALLHVDRAVLARYRRPYEVQLVTDSSNISTEQRGGTSENSA